MRVFGQTLFIEAVAHFVQGAVEGVCPLFTAVAGGEPDIARPHAGTEGVRGGVEPPGFEIEAHFFEHKEAQCVLNFGLELEQ